MEGLLTPVSTSYKTTGEILGDALVEVSKRSGFVSKPILQASTPEEALEILKSEPDHATLITTLKYLKRDNSGFDITSPSPLAAQLVHALVSDIVPNYWNVLSGSDKGKKSTTKREGRPKNPPELDILLSYLRSVTGLNAVLLSLKQQIQRSKETKKAIRGQGIQDAMVILLQMLQALLEGDETARTIWETIWNTEEPESKKKALWREFLSLASGNILGLAAEAEDIINEFRKKSGVKYWIADGSLYAVWLASNITHWARGLSAGSESRWEGCSQLLSKSFRLGYTESIIKEVLASLLLQSNTYPTQFTKLFGILPNFEQRNFIYTITKIMSKEHLSAEITTEADSQWWKSDAGIVSAAAGLINLMLANEESRKSHLIAWLTSSSGAGIGDGIAIRRAAVAALAADKNDIESVLEKSLHQFGDQLYIRHTPAMQQEVHAQVLLLSAGYIHRKAPLRLSMMMRSGAHLSVISNRLAASSPRARFLGMVIGEALSSLVDKGDKKMDFKIEQMSAPEAKWYKSLVNVSDTIGSLEPLRSGPVTKAKNAESKSSQKMHKAKPVNIGSKIVAIEEIEDNEEEKSDNDGLIPYAKPDSDAEDSDEDPTLITRNKPTAPVYIRDLITYLKETENYDKQKLGLATAAPLIRRKANFGSEVSSHAEELATLLVGIQDKYEIDDFQDMRLQGMIAILIALPQKMGQWFSKTFFDGDYSISQRASILTTLGLGARELGGFGSEDNNLTSNKALPSSFPSKALPESMHRQYNSTIPSPLTALDTLSAQLQNTMIAPMATSLADKLTGPSILKVRTFSSRMAVEKKRKRPIANELAKVVSEGLFFPLTGRFLMHLRAYGSSKSNIVFQPHLLSHFIKTLSLLLHASGPSTLSLPQMTSEFWDLLLSLRTQSIGDIVVIEALLFAFLTILEINEDKRRLVDVHGRQMLETQEWVEGVFGRVAAGGSQEDERVKMLAAGCLVRIREIVEKYQALLMGDLASF